LIVRLAYVLFFVLFITFTPFLNQSSCQILVNLKKEFEKAKNYKETVLVYQENFGYHSSFFSGTVYSLNNTKTNSHPFFQSDEWQYGDILINGLVFFNREIKLDIHKDALILNHQIGDFYNQAIVLEDRLLKGVSFSDRYFINIQREEAESLLIKEGYYEQVYYDKCIVLVKYRKSIIREFKFSTDLIEEFVGDIDYFLICNGRASTINSKKALVKAFPKHNKKVKRFIKDTRIKFGKQKLENIIKIVRYYDSLDS
jgi:hypothetical protein